MLQRTHTRSCLLKGLFSSLCSETKKQPCPRQGSYQMGGRESDRRGCWCEVECDSSFSPFPYYHFSFQCPPPTNLGMNTACHPLGGWRSRAVVKKLMPTFSKRRVQCVCWNRGKGVKGLVEEAARSEERLGHLPSVTVGILVLPLPLPAPSTPFF